MNEEANANVVISNTDSWVEQEKEVCACVRVSEACIHYCGDTELLTPLADGDKSG